MLNRRDKALINVIVFSIVLMLYTTFIIYIANFEQSKDNSNKVITNVKEIKSMEPYETCINGNKVVIVNGSTYYAGIIDTWNDIKTIKCE